MTNNPEPIHSLISPSYLKQLLLCSKSLPKDAEAIDDTNEAAKAGTLQHAYLCALLELDFHEKYVDFDLGSLTDEEKSEVMDVYEMVHKEYAFFKRKYSRVEVLLETRVNLDDFLPGPAWGFVDVAFIGHKAKPNSEGIYTNSAIYVLDAKFGRVEVPVIDANKHLNPQLTAYWVGIANSVKNTNEITRGYLMILQPKLNNYPSFTGKTSVFTNYMNNVISPRAYEAFNDTGAYSPSLDNCKYCKNSKHCKFHNIIVMAQLQMLENPDMLSDEYIEKYVLPNITNLKKYCDNVWDYAVKKAETANKKWSGFTLGTSRPSRVYIDESAVKDIALREGIDGLLTESVLSPAQAEKLLGKERFAELLADQVTYKPGKVTLVPDAPAKKTSANNAKKDFKENK